MGLPLKLLPGLAYAADTSTRQDAVRGRVVNERDYVSSWLATTRNLWRMLGGSGYCATLPAVKEQEIGCDGLFVLQGPDFHKYFYFEAKRVKMNFDKKQKASICSHAEYGVGVAGVGDYSHFSDQIGRQAQWLVGHPNDVIAELFLNFEEVTPPLTSPPFDLYGSTVVRHPFARGYVSPPATGSLAVTDTWSPADVTNICTTTPATSIETALDDVVNCQLGDRIPNGLAPAEYEVGFSLNGNATAARKGLDSLGLGVREAMPWLDMLGKLDQRDWSDRRQWLDGFDWSDTLAGLGGRKGFDRLEMLGLTKTLGEIGIRHFAHFSGDFPNPQRVG